MLQSRVDWAWRETLPPGPSASSVGRIGQQHGVDWGITSRRGGVSAPPWDSLNLGGAVGDNPASVAANRAAVAAELGCDAELLVLARQCHGADVAVVDGPWAGEAPEVDALVTSSGDVALAVLVADCVPVLLSDRRAGVVAAAHSGRQGLVAGVVPAAIAAMIRLGAEPAQIRAVVGPSVCGRCYEVPAALAADVGSAVPLTSTSSWTGTPALDLASGVVGQLRSAGVAVRWLPGCTRERPDLYSYRRDRHTGRFAAVVRLLR